MSTVQFATRVDERAAMEFRDIAARLGTTPSDALRMFVSAFNACKGFPFDVRLNATRVEPFESESDAMDFVSAYAERALNEAW